MNKFSFETAQSVAAVYDRRRLGNTFSFHGDGHRPPLQQILFALLLGLFLPIGLPAQTGPTDTVGKMATVVFHIGHASLAAQIAATPEQEERGLMYVTKLPDNDGMLFVLPVGHAEFWMKNTLIPLSIAFIDKNGVILDIHDMKPLDETITRSDGDQVAYALETNLHWFALNGIKAGDKIEPPPASAVKSADHALEILKSMKPNNTDS